MLEALDSSESQSVIRDVPPCDAIVIGSGPNGLAAAMVMAQAGASVSVLEAQPTMGGGARSAPITLPGFMHDLGSAVHPLGLGSPFFRSLPLAEHGLEWIHPAVPLAHPLDDGTAIVLDRSVELTAQGLGQDAAAYRRLMQPLVSAGDDLLRRLLAPRGFTRDLVSLARFGVQALRSATGLAGSRFRHEPARALFGGLAAHSALPLEKAGSAGFGLALGVMAHTLGWPFPSGGAQKITDALAARLQALGGKIFTDCRVDSLDQLPPARVILCDVTPRQLLRIAGQRFPSGFRRKLERYRYGPGAFKVDWALDGPIPWRAQSCLRAGTIHLGGRLAEIAQAERAPWGGQHAERPYVLLAQPSLFDPVRAPAGQHTAWAYCHVPNSSSYDMLERIEAQIERFAPGFRKRILARAMMNTCDLEAANGNLVGGDISGGAVTLDQLFFRPTRSLHRTPAKGIYICSSSTPPGPGVHGMCGYYAAQLALRELR